MIENDGVSQNKTKVGYKVLGRQIEFSRRDLLIFCSIFAALVGIGLYLSFAYSPTTENLANGTTPNGYHTACIDNTGDSPSHEFIHVNSCSQAEKSEGWTNSSTFIWCADLDGSISPAENNWLNDGGCPPQGGGVSIDISASPTSINPGQSTLISWTVNGSAYRCYKKMANNSPNNDPNWTGDVGMVGNVNWFPPSTPGQYIYGIRCDDAGGNKLATNATGIWVNSPPAGGSATVTVTANPQYIYAGQSSTISWTVSGSSTCTKSSTDTSFSGTAKTPNGSQSVSPTAPTTYTVNCTNASGSGSAKVGINFNQGCNGCLPVSVTALPVGVTAGQSSVISWSVPADAACTKSSTDNSFTGNLSSPTGSQSVLPASTTTYTIQCSDPTGTGTGNATVTVGTKNGRNTKDQSPDDNVAGDNNPDCVSNCSIKAKIHLIYAVPSNYASYDVFQDTSGVLASAFSNSESWFQGQAGGKKLRLDTYNGNPDITYVVLLHNDKQLGCASCYDVIENDLKTLGFTQANKIYAVYYAGPSDYAAGWAYVPGQYAIEANSNFPSAPGPDLVMLHEITHSLGFLQQCSKNFDSSHPNHAKDSTLDLMYYNLLPPLDTKVLDYNHDDYFKEVNSKCTLDLNKSNYLAIK